MKNLNPGRELDAQVAEKVMGFRRLPMCGPNGEVFENWQRPHESEQWLRTELPHYSTEIAAAWEVVGKIGLVSLINGPDGWKCSFGVRKDHKPGDFSSSWEFSISQVDARGATAPHTICLAALKAVGA